MPSFPLKGHWQNSLDPDQMPNNNNNNNNKKKKKKKKKKKTDTDCTPR